MKRLAPFAAGALASALVLVYAQGAHALHLRFFVRGCDRCAVELTQHVQAVIAAQRQGVAHVSS